MNEPMPNIEQEFKSVWTPANKVTLARILLVPVFVAVMITPWPEWFGVASEVQSWKPWVAAFVFIAIAATDSIDGHLARSRGEVTTLGQFMDPLADKILVCAALLALVELGPLPSWVALVILTREFIVSGIRMVAASKNVVMPASWYGKAKTVSQVIAIVLFIIKDSEAVVNLGPGAFNALYVFSWFVMTIAIVLTIFSMIDYFAKASNLLGFTRKKHRRRKKAEQTADGGSDAPAEGQAESAGQVDRATLVVRTAAEQHVTLGTAESCTGGGIGAAITSVPGSSAVFAGGVISYANDVKEQALGVDAATLQAAGAVSREVARAMAQGARDALSVDVAVSATGIAGPDGGSKEKPVGTVWIGIADEGGSEAFEHRFQGNREQVRKQTVDAALELIAARLNERATHA